MPSFTFYSTSVWFFTIFFSQFSWSIGNINETSMSYCGSFSLKIGKKSENGLNFFLQVYEIDDGDGNVQTWGNLWHLFQWLAFVTASMPINTDLILVFPHSASPKPIHDNPYQWRMYCKHLHLERKKNKRKYIWSDFCVKTLEKRYVRRQKYA